VACHSSDSGIEEVYIHYLNYFKICNYGYRSLGRHEDELKMAGLRKDPSSSPAALDRWRERPRNARRPGFFANRRSSPRTSRLRKEIP
jgi:hypothetical protein